MKTGSSRNS